MAKVTYIDHQNNHYQVQTRRGESLMQAAVNNDVPGIIGECGGAAACATCHVYVDPEWVDVAGDPNPMEAGLLETLANKRETSRLSCQIFMFDVMDGLVVHVPEDQY